MSPGKRFGCAFGVPEASVVADRLLAPTASVTGVSSVMLAVRGDGEPVLAVISSSPDWFLLLMRA